MIKMLIANPETLTDLEPDFPNSYSLTIKVRYLSWSCHQLAQILNSPICHHFFITSDLAISTA